MARQPKPWFRKSRNAWFVTVNGQQHNPGEDKQEAYEIIKQKPPFIFIDTTDILF